MKLNLSRKPVLTPNPSPDKLSAADCFIARDKWFKQALKSEIEVLPMKADLAFQKAVQYENMAFDGRK